MLKFIARRLLFTAFVALAIVFFCFLGMGMVRNSSTSRPSYNLPFYARQAARSTTAWVRKAARGDLGQAATRRAPQPITDILADTYKKSMGLLLASLALAAVLGLSVGIFAGLREHSWQALLVLTLTLLGISTPSFFAALALQVGEIRFLQMTGIRLLPVGGFGWDRHIVMPALVLAARPVAQLARVTFMSIAEVLDQDYIRTARAKGLTHRMVLNRHTLRNALVPILTAVGVSLRFSLGSLPVVELYFGWPGMGDRLLEAIRGGETQVVVALAVVLGLTFMFVNLLLDIIYRLIDPRLREVSS